MKPSLSWRFAMLVVLACAAVDARAQDAAALRTQASSEMNQEKQVQLLCKAADLEPGNKVYRSECEVRKAALINNDRQALKTALDANDAGQVAKAKRYAKYVSSFDADTHHQAEQLLAKLNGADSSPQATVSPAAPPPQAAASGQGAILAQAVTAYENGNLQAARSGAQSITETSIKPAASHLLAEIDHYSNLVNSGQKHERAKEFAEAESAYRSALEINARVASDDLAGKSQRMHQLAATSQNSVVATREAPKPNRAPVEISAEERTKRLLDESAQAMGRNDLDTAGKKFKQVLDLDASNATAKQGMAEITARLNKDPVRLEKTLREAILAFYNSHFEDAESGLNRYLGADVGKKKGAAYFYLGATEATLSLLNEPSKRASRSKEAQADFKQARSAGYVPVEKYVSARVLEVWKTSGL